MKFVVGDIGNSEIKLCLLDYNYKIIKKICFETNKIKQKNFLKRKIKLLIKSYEITAPIFFSSVVPSAYKKIKKIFYKNFQISCKELKQIDFNKIIKTKVNKRQIGSDRIANAIGAFYFYKSNCIIIDFGTATTFDVVIKGVYKGGIIAPGVKLSLENLVNKASLIPHIKLNKISNIIGKNTISSVKSGFYWGYVGLINNILTLIIKKTKTKYNIIFTGGLANLFKSSLHYKIKLDKDVTLNGLIRVIKSQIL